jgi:hypothetical protein
MRSPSSSGQLKNVELLKRAIKDHQIEGFSLNVAQMNWESINSLADFFFGRTFLLGAKFEESENLQNFLELKLKDLLFFCAASVQKL